MGTRKRKIPTAEWEEDSDSKSDSDSNVGFDDRSDDDFQESDSYGEDDADADSVDTAALLKGEIQKKKPSSAKKTATKASTPKDAKVAKTATKASAPKSRAKPMTPVTYAKKRPTPASVDASSAHKKAKIASTPAKSLTGSSKSTPKSISSATKHGINLSDKPDSYEVTIPPNFLGHASNSSAAGPCLVMVQVDPEDAAVLDFEGASGAIGRFEANPAGIVVDLKGCQYQGSILPGPTAMVVGFTSSVGFGRSTSAPTRLHVEGITDEFVTLVKTNDSMLQLDAIVKGNMDISSFQVHDENVNRTSSKKD
jgi:hypothetical protein